jgi:hypothetical protein
MNAWRFLSLVMLTVLSFTTSMQDVLSSGCVPITEEAQSKRDSRSTLGEQISSIPFGTLLQIRLRDNRKLTGRIGAVSQEQFELQTMQANIVVKEIIAFKDVKSFKRLNDQPGGASRRNMTALWAVIGFVGGLLTYIALHRRR